MIPPVLTKLRDIVPLRPLRHSEALQIAEIQAQRLLALSRIAEPPVPERVIAQIPKIEITRLSPFPTSGASHWAAGRWLVGINGSEPMARQRFSLAHEFKHIVDHRFVHLIYSEFPERERAGMVEQICDYFAGCVLMPRPWVKRIYDSGVQYAPDLAHVFGVSRAAMAVRLRQLGMPASKPRCLPRTDWTQWNKEVLSHHPWYQREACYVT